MCSPNRNPRHAYGGSDGTRTGKPGQGQGGVVASVRGNESRNSPELPSSAARGTPVDRKSTRLNSSHTVISYAVFCLKKKKHNKATDTAPTTNNRTLTAAA